MSPPTVQRPANQLSLPSQPTYTQDRSDGAGSQSNTLNQGNLLSTFGTQSHLLDSAANTMAGVTPKEPYETVLPRINASELRNLEEINVLVNAMLQLLKSDPQMYQPLPGETAPTSGSDVTSASASDAIFKVASNIRQAVSLSGSQGGRSRSQLQVKGNSREVTVIPSGSSASLPVKISLQEIEKLSLILASVIKLQYPGDTSLPAPADVAAAITNSPELLSPLLALQTSGNSRSRSVRSAFNSTVPPSSLLSLLLSPFDSPAPNAHKQGSGALLDGTKTTKPGSQEGRSIGMNLSDVNINMQRSSHGTLTSE